MSFTQQPPSWSPSQLGFSELEGPAQALSGPPDVPYSNLDSLHETGLQGSSERVDVNGWTVVVLVGGVYSRVLTEASPPPPRSPSVVPPLCFHAKSTLELLVEEKNSMFGIQHVDASISVLANVPGFCSFFYSAA